MLKEITYVTGNWAKIQTAKMILEPMGIKVNHIKMSTHEIQDDDIENIANASAKEASEKLKCDVLKNDTGFFIEALNGFPGPYTHYADEHIGEDGILKLLEGKTNRRAYFKECFAYCEYGKEPVAFSSITYGTITKEKHGEYGWSWDYIFVADGTDKTLACFKDEERLLIWSHKGFEDLANYLLKKQ
ncbi:MAG: non-canonical purine NTP pyrophosphatase [Clostridia bacterium]|nr:non-canonical purine NTP pyrophosphatase [Clostridia bacterium]